MAIALRHRAAVEALALTGTEAVLEIGCGQGVATRRLIERLPRGHVVALDRSAKMIEALSRAAADHLAAGRLVVRAEALETAELPAAGFDRILAINVDLILRLEDRWPEMLRRPLRPDGLVVLAFEAPPGSSKAESFATRSATMLEDAGFACSSELAQEGKTNVRVILARAGR